MSTSGDDKTDFSDSDKEWFAALSGQAPRGADSRAVREGHALRTALEMQIGEIDASAELDSATSEAAMEAKLHRLLERADVEGVFDRSPPDLAATASPTSNVVAFPWWRRRKTLVAMAASVLVGIVAVGQWPGRPDYPEPPAMLGVGGVRQVQSTSPRATAEALAARLRENGLRPGLYQRGRTYVVDITLMASELPSAHPSFEALGVDPVAGFNRIEIAPR